MTKSPDKKSYNVAVIGSGPAGFFAAEALLKAELDIHVDVFERLHSPFGLVRYGVAPDHPKTKNVISKLSQIAESENLRFLGNVEVGIDISFDVLRSRYDAVIIATGAIIGKRPGIPGEELPGSNSAVDFVGWYNGHPDYCHRTFDLSHTTAAVIGHGNVALDVARILAKPASELSDSDISPYALDALRQSAIRTIYLIGRRGPVQASFSFKDLKELVELPDCSVEVAPDDLQLNEASKSELESGTNRFAKQNYALLSERTERARNSKSVVIKFLSSPVAIDGSDRVTKLRIEVNELTGKAGAQKARGTGVTKAIDCGLILHSIGQTGEAISGVPFEAATGTVPNDEGRVLKNGNIIPGIYVVGWIKRGSDGLIGTNKRDSTIVVQHVLQDLTRLTAADARARSVPITDLLTEKNHRVVTWDDWKRLDDIELAEGHRTGKFREKICRREDVARILES